MTEQMTPQEMAKELEKNPLHTSVMFSKRYNTVCVNFDPSADTAAAVEANLTEMGFQGNGYGMMRYDGQRIARVQTAQEIQATERAAELHRSSTGAEYLYK